jgi:DNA-binding transcriptional MerR regulator
MGLSIGDVEKITGISKDRLRYYEEKRLITPVRDTDISVGVTGTFKPRIFDRVEFIEQRVLTVL